jgi:dUTP pyrophosphatase
MNDFTVHFWRLPNNPDLPLPQRETEGAVGYDIRSAEPDFVLQPGERRFVSAGLAIELPANIECQVRPRSGLARDHGVILLYSPSTIDPDYRGELFAPLWNTGSKPVSILRGMRVAQIVFQPTCLPVILEVEEAIAVTPRGPGGFGSTGHA